MPYREYSYVHRQPWHGSVVSSRHSASHGQGCATDSYPAPQANRMADLPALLVHRIIAFLDHGSRLELRKIDRRCRQLVDSSWRLVCVPLDHLRRHDMQQLSQRFSTAACLVICEPQQRISLSALGYRRRCEHLLAVFLDNAAPWAHLVALDLSHALTSLSANCLELLSSSLPSLQHLALPKVAAGAEFAHAPAHEVLHLVSGMQELRSLELDCSLLVPKRSNNGAGQDKQALTLAQSTDAARLSTLQQLQLTAYHPSSALVGTGTLVLSADSMKAPTVHSTVQDIATLCTAQQLQTLGVGPFSRSSNDSSRSIDPMRYADSTCDETSSVGKYSISSSQDATSSYGACASSSQQQEYHAEHLCNPWLQLHHLRNLQQLQLLNPLNLQETLPALAGLTGLGMLGLSRVQLALCNELLDPGHEGSFGKGLGTLSGLPFLTRLELGLEQPCSCNSDGIVIPPKLVVPAHSDIDSGAPGVTAPSAFAQPLSMYTSAIASGTATSAVHYYQTRCCWSHLAHLNVLILSGVCLDSPVLSATAECQQLTELRVGGILLEQQHPCMAIKPLQELRVLAVSRWFDLGSNSATVLFPQLTKLSIKDDSSCCPDLSCLQHHPTLEKLSIETAGSGWQLAALQLNYLVHVSSLRQLSLASVWCGTHSGHNQHPLPHQQHMMSPGRAGLMQHHHHPPMLLKSPTGRGSSAASSSHWLPTASLTQVTSLTLSGPCNDHTLSQLPNQFPGMVSLQLLGSYYASDQGLKRLCRAPHLSALLLDGCDHVTEYGLEVLIHSGSIRVLVVQGCSGVDERACQRIRRACRNSCTCLHWHGTDGSRCSHGGLSASSSSGYISPYFDMQDTPQHHHHHHQHTSSNSSINRMDSFGLHAAGVASGAGSCCPHNCHCSSGSVFLERCWQEAEAAKAAAKAAVSSDADAQGLSKCSAGNVQQEPQPLEVSARAPMHDAAGRSRSISCSSDCTAVGCDNTAVSVTADASIGVQTADMELRKNFDRMSIDIDVPSCRIQQQQEQHNQYSSRHTLCVIDRSAEADIAGKAAAEATLVADSPDTCTEPCTGTAYGRSKSASSIASSAALCGRSSSETTVSITRSTSTGCDMAAGGSSGSRRMRTCVSTAGDVGSSFGMAGPSWPRHSHSGYTAAH